MPVNRKHVEVIKSALRKHAKSYNQNTFGSDRPECGTVMCIAGFCRVEEVGLKQFRKEIRLDPTCDFDLDDACLGSAMKFLGLKGLKVITIFASAEVWPNDLANAYKNATSHKERAEVACQALDRLNVDGSIKKLRRKKTP
jgi:hypothetical protein